MPITQAAKEAQLEPDTVEGKVQEWETEGLSLNIRLLLSRGDDGGESFF